MGDKLIIKQINKKYDTERALENVLRYIIRKKSNEEEGEVVYWKALGASGKSIGSAIRQFIKIQEMAGKANKKRVRHFIISLPKCVNRIKEAVTVADAVAAYIFRDYQVIIITLISKTNHLVFIIQIYCNRNQYGFYLQSSKVRENGVDIIFEFIFVPQYLIVELES